MTDTPTTTPTRTTATGLDRIARPDGTFAIVAMDQRNTLRRMFATVGRTPDDADMTDLKADIARALSPSASAMLVDHPGERRHPRGSGGGVPRRVLT